MNKSLHNYLVVTAGYWAFTITDGAIRMLVVLYFHLLGYSPLQVAMLFLFYEFFGIVTNLVGGWLGARIGLNRTMNIGMAMQVVALLALTVPDSWLSVPYVMAAQALSGIAKDLNKMSAKASVKAINQSGDASLFKWVAILTGSKNALKGLGFLQGRWISCIVGNWLWHCAGFITKTIAKTSSRWTQCALLGIYTGTFPRCDCPRPASGLARRTGYYYWTDSVWHCFRHKFCDSQLPDTGVFQS